MPWFFRASPRQQAGLVATDWKGRGALFGDCFKPAQGCLIITEKFIRAGTLPPLTRMAPYEKAMALEKDIEAQHAPE